MSEGVRAGGFASGLRPFSLEVRVPQNARWRYRGLFCYDGWSLRRGTL